MKERFTSDIDRVDRKLAIKIGGKAVVFSYLNTKLYEHAPGYEQFDHVFRLSDDNPQAGAFYLRSAAPELYNVLQEHGFPRSIMPYPSPSDEQTIMAHYDREMHNGLNELLEGSDE